jgi:histidine triad (HIT) family protein
MLSSEQTVQFKEQILAMGPEELEGFIKKNKLIKNQSEQECIFCSIVSEKIQSYKLDENKSATAIFEINPISKGHILIIPKEHKDFKDKIPARFETFAKKIAKKVKTKLKPKKVEIHPANLFGHSVLNVLPIYENETINSERHKATRRIRRC